MFKLSCREKTIGHVFRAKLLSIEAIQIGNTGTQVGYTGKGNAFDEGVLSEGKTVAYKHRL